jgi:nitrogen fixation protein NifZ
MGGNNMKLTYQEGQQVRVIRAIRNDGTFPNKARGDLLVRRGSLGYVREWGTFLQDEIIYQVHFLDEDCIVGCREQELIDGQAPWIAGKFQYGDWVSAQLPLATGGKIAVATGDVGQVMGTADDLPADFHYVVLFGQRLFQVPESALCAQSMTE